MLFPLPPLREAKTMTFIACQPRSSLAMARGDSSKPDGRTDTRIDAAPRHGPHAGPQAPDSDTAATQFC
jgi:hypothetical protein